MSSSGSGGGDNKKHIVVDPFCFRQFSEHKEASQSYKGTVFGDVSVSEMEDIVNSFYQGDESKLVNGYAPFCKHLFIENKGISESAKVNVLEITPDNEHLLRTEYQARNDKELPVLVRYFPESVKEKLELPTAKYLDFILYSREQIQKENAAQGDDEDSAETAPWGIVSIKAQDTATENPMTPITAMRNALGKEEGGSGVPLNREE
eukprot:CAMPEP_0168859168 /NCGR_PEP_ID=MMETSP0727-20121128/16682_1 /TAXON_ID=265536 /ORGANISM="Amphiprora sp., Strain CCMP467" /LENGTH=205 /DNA_ID=CAMNT_0008913971 /DNA_START=106 /DNA_END=720 /DNA_ORIENTATION=+